MEVLDQLEVKIRITIQKNAELQARVNELEEEKRQSTQKLQQLLQEIDKLEPSEQQP